MRANASAVAARQQLGELPARRLRNALETLLQTDPAADDHGVPLDDVHMLQGMALDLLPELFQNAFGDDLELLDAVAEKQSAFADVRGGPLRHAVFGGADARAVQANALALVLRTFRGHDDDDALRRACLQKIGYVGTLREAPLVQALVRKGTASDLHHGLAALRTLTKRFGVPQPRTLLRIDPEIGPLLRKPRLDPDERRRAIEAVMARGEIASVRAHSGSNLNQVFFVTFADTLPAGHDDNGHVVRETVRGVWKPEATWLGKDRAFFAREVAVYELDQKLTRTGIVPPTVETMLDLDGKGARVGSMQWMVEGARQLGLSPTEHDPRFDAFRQSARYREQESNIRMLLYLFSDPDKLSNNVIATPNLANILVDRDEKLWMIDNGYSLGAPPAEVSPSILPKQLPAQTSRPPSVIEPPTLWQRVADAFLESETVRALVARANRLKAWLGGDESVRPRSPQ